MCSAHPLTFGLASVHCNLELELMAKIYVAGHQGMVGSAISRKLLNSKKHEIVTRTRAELDLTIQSAVR